MVAPVAEELKPAYLLTGSDRPKIERALRRLRRRVGDDAVEILSATEASGEDAVAACNALGLFGGGSRLVLVEGAEKWRAPDAKAVAAYLADPAPATVLALEATGLKRDAPLAKAVAKHGELLAYDVAKKELPRWTIAQFKRLGVEAELEAGRTLVELVFDDEPSALDALESEIVKLATWAGGERIGAREVKLLATPVAETSIFDLTDAWGRRDVGATLDACESLLEQGGGNRRDEVARLTALVANHVGRVRQCQTYEAEGLRPKEAASRMKRSPYYVEKLFSQARNFTVDELRTCVVRLAALDLALKGGSRLASDLELQRALVELTRPVEPAEVAAAT